MWRWQPSVSRDWVQICSNVCHTFRARFAEMMKLIHARGKEEGISLDDYRVRNATCPPVAIPSFRREDKLCLQTLSLLRFYKWDMSRVHVFVDPQARRDNGASEYDVYWRYMRRIHSGWCTFILEGPVCAVSTIVFLSSSQVSRS